MICRRSLHPWPRIITWLWPKTWRTWRKKDSGRWSGWDPAAVSCRWGEPAGQWQHAQTMVVPRAPPQLSEHDDYCSCNLPNPDKLLCGHCESKPSPEGNSGNLISSSARLTHEKPSQLYNQSHSALRIHCDASFMLVLSALMPDALVGGWRKRTGRAKVRGGVKWLNFRRHWSKDGWKMDGCFGMREQINITYWFYSNTVRSPTLWACYPGPDAAQIQRTRRIKYYDLNHTQLTHIIGNSSCLQSKKIWI